MHLPGRKSRGQQDKFHQENKLLFFFLPHLQQLPGCSYLHAPIAHVTDISIKLPFKHRHSTATLAPVE